MRGVLGWIGLGLGLLAAPASAELVAERIGSERIDALRVGGPDSDAGIGDWALRNGVVCAAISDASHESHLSDQGGILIDLGHCGRSNDQWSVEEELLDFQRGARLTISRIDASIEGDRARITVGAEGRGLVETTTFELRPGEAWLTETTTLERVTEGPALWGFATMILHATGQLRPFTLYRESLGASVGFDHPAAELRTPLSMLNALVPWDLLVFVGEPSIAPEIAYGVERVRTERVRDGVAEPVASVSITGESYTIAMVFSDPFWLGGGGRAGWLQLPQVPLMDLDVGERLEFERRIHLGDRADVSSVTDRLYPQAPLVSGRVSTAGTHLHVRGRDGAPITSVRPRPDGSFSFRSPSDLLEIVARAPSGAERVREVSVERDTQLAPFDLDPDGTIVIPSGLRGRFLIRGEGETPDPVLRPDLLDFRVGGALARHALASGDVSRSGNELEAAEIALRPGRYRVVLTRGLEYTVTETSVVLEPGERKALALEAPERVLDTPGWISADLHVHSGESWDSSLPLPMQIAAFVAQGAEVLVSTEHDRIVDPTAEIARLGLGESIVGMTGVEVTSGMPGGESPYTIGHQNAFPVEAQRDAYRGGAPRAEGRRLRDVVAEVRGLPGRPLLQLNHPRRRSEAPRLDELNYFSHLAVPGESYRPDRPLDAEPNRWLVEPDPDSGLRDLDYDAVELLNGAGLVNYRLVRADWISLLLQGVRHVGTANSDSHVLGEVAGVPRTYVRMARDHVVGFEQRRFMDALRDGRAFGTTGPMLDVALGDSGPGETFWGKEGVLRISVDAAPWVPVAELRVTVDSELVLQESITAGTRRKLPLAFARDGFVLVEVEGPGEGLYRDVLPGFTPLAFANPIFVDADGDGSWTPPGLPDSIPDVLARPLETP